MTRTTITDANETWLEFDKWESMGCGFCYVEAGQRCVTSSGKPRRNSHSRRLFWVRADREITAERIDGYARCQSHSYGDRVQCERPVGHPLPHESKDGQVLWLGLGFCIRTPETNNEHAPM